VPFLPTRASLTVPAASMLASSVPSEKVAVMLAVLGTFLPVGVVALTVGAVLSTTTVTPSESSETLPESSVTLAL